MQKKLLLIFVLLVIFGTTVRAQEHPGFYVLGRHLYDQCGEKVILRGVANPNIWYEKDGERRYGEIAQTGANVVRIVWETKGSASDLDAAIANCIQYKMIPMVELHDATGKWDKLQMCVDYWTRIDVARTLMDYEEYLLLNIANECGDYNVSTTAFKNGYEAAIKQIREADIHVPLVIDGTDWGKNINILQSQGPYLIEADPDHNLLFSVHMWWPKMYGYTETSITSEIAQSVKMELPLIVGEFAQMHGECTTSVITPQNSINYLKIIEECHKNEIGWIAWSWFGNCNPFWDLSSAGTYESLYSWGLEVAVTSPYSIQNTSVRPYSIVNGRCNPTFIENDVDFIQPAEFELSQNFPNPLNMLTRINFKVTEPAKVTLAIYDMQGRRVRTLVDEWKSAGNYTVAWNGRNDAGEVVATGIYVYQLSFRHNDQIMTQSNKLVLLK